MKISVTSPKHGTYEILVDDEDYNLIKDHTIYVWTTARHHTLYAMMQVEKGLNVRLHRIIMNAKHGEIVDHINGNGLDNRRSNLRITDSTGNNQNVRKRKNAMTSSYKGVHFCKSNKKWKAQIQVNGKKLSLGYHKTEIEAAKAYNQAAELHFKAFAALNK